MFQWNISTFSQYHRNIVSELSNIKTIPEFEKEIFFSNVRKMPTSVNRKQTLVSIMKGEKGENPSYPSIKIFVQDSSARYFHKNTMSEIEFTQLLLDVRSF